MNRAAAPTVLYEQTAGIDLDRLLGLWAGALDEREAERLSGLRFERDRRDYLAAHVLLRLALRDEWGRDPALPLPAHRSGWSLTHCDGLVACALAAPRGDGVGLGVGVDAEHLSSADRLEAMPEAFLSPGDAGWLGMDQALRPRRLVELWTVKEALLKARGEGITGPAGTAVLRALECTPIGTVDEWATIAVRDVHTNDRVLAWVRCVGEHVLAVVSLGTHDGVPRLSRLPLQ
jgi:phosphopantetheinyl transferase